MIEADLRTCDRIFPLWARAMPWTATVALLSPWPVQESRARDLFRGAVIDVLDRDAWDLDRPPPGKWDLIVAQGVLEYSPDPPQWFGRLFSACRHLWVQGSCTRWRGEKGLGTDGDRVRYSFGRGMVSRHPEAFDLAVYADRLCGFHQYDAGDGPPEYPSWHFLLWLQGDLP